MSHNDRAILTQLFQMAVAAADPNLLLAEHLPKKPDGKTIVIGAGKGAAQMAAAFEKMWNGPLIGTIVTRYGYGVQCERIKVLEASHPVPDEAGLAASDEIMGLLTGLSPDDLVIALICGGGSALLPAPPEGFSLKDEQGLNQELLNSGAPISAMNAIRKQFSRIKGGRLAALAHPARVVSLIVSDVPGDAPEQVASGPTVPDVSDAKTALEYISNYGISIPEPILQHIKTSVSPDPSDSVFSRNLTTVVASARLSLEAAAEKAKMLGIEAVILSDSIEGEAIEIARMHGAIAREIKANDRPFSKPVIILSGGETTVTVRGNGRGGRNSEFLLSLAREIDGIEGITALAADTDGIDGTQDNAGAFIDGTSAARLRSTGKNASQYLANNDAYSAFEVLGDLFSTGRTGTNVNDFRAILIK